MVSGVSGIVVVVVSVVYCCAITGDSDTIEAKRKASAPIAAKARTPNMDSCWL